MKEITRVHLAKTPYSVELDAKKQLEEYLVAIEKTMQAEPGAMQEIEARMVELLAERGVKTDAVIALADVEALREQLGEPKAFSSSDEEFIEVEAADVVEKPIKRFMRDTDNAVLGGVCSGLAAYFNFDVLLVRLLMVALLVASFGTVFLIYIVFWIVTPAARTAADKLAMAGKPVTLEALKSSSEIETQEPKSRVAVKVVRAVLGVIGLFAVFGALVAVLVGSFVGYDAVSWLEGMSVQPWAYGLLGSLIVGGIALVMLLSLLTFTAFAWKLRRPVGLAMLAMLLVGAIAVSGVAIAGTQIGMNIQRDEKKFAKTEKIDFSDVSLDGIKRVQVVGAYYSTSKTDGDLKAELSYSTFKDVAKPNVKVHRENDVLWINIDSTESRKCPVLWGSCYSFGQNPGVKISLPADVDMYDAQDVTSDDAYGVDVDVDVINSAVR